MRNVILMMLLAGLCIPGRGEDWPSFRGFDGRRGTSEQAITDALTEQWVFDTVGNKPIFASPVVAEGYVIVCDQGGKVYVLNETTGAPAYPALQVGTQIDGAPLIVNGRVYVGSVEGVVTCFDIDTGAIVWTTELRTGIRSSPILVGDSLYFTVGIPMNGLVRLNASTGGLTGNFATAQPSFSTPVYFNDYIYFGDNSAQLYAVHHDTLALKPDFATGGIWSTPDKGGFVFSSVMYSGGKLYFAAGGADRKFYILDAVTGATIANSTHPVATLTSRVSSPAVSGAKVYYVGDDPAVKVFELDASTGVFNPAFTTDIGTDTRFPNRSTPALSGDYLFVGNGGPDAQVLDQTPGGRSDPVTPGATSIRVTSTAGFPASGKIVINGDEIDYSGKTADSFTGVSGVEATHVEGSRVYPVGDPCYLKIIRLSTGAVSQKDVRGPVYASPAIANGRVIVGTYAGRLHAFRSNLNTAPTAPVSGFAPTGSTNVLTNTPVLSWDAGSDAQSPGSQLRYLLRWDYDGEVLRNFAGEVLTSPGVVAYTMPVVPNNTQVTWRVRAVDPQGAMSRWTAPQQFWVNRLSASAPAPPRDLWALPFDQRVDLVWQRSPSPDVALQRLVWGPSSGPFTTLDLAATAESWTFPGLTNGVPYTFTLFAVDFEGNTSASISASATPLPPISINGTAYSSVEAAAAAASPGDTILLGVDTFFLTSTVVLKEGVTLKGYSPLHTILDAGGLGTAIAVTQTGASSPAVIRDLLVKGSTIGISAGSSKVDIRNTVLTLLHDAVVMATGSVVRVINNTITNNTGNGVEAPGGSLELWSNILLGNFEYGVYNSEASVTGGYNNLYANVLGSFFSAVSLPGTLSMNVTFRNAGGLDFREVSGSATIDAGDPTADYSKEPSPNGARINQGAFGNTPFATRSSPSMAASAGGGGGGGGCFIATAVVGSIFEGKLAHYYGLRDRMLRTNLPGSDFVRLYYKNSPPVADYIRNKPTLRALTRKALEILD